MLSQQDVNGMSMQHSPYSAKITENKDRTRWGNKANTPRTETLVTWNTVYCLSAQYKIKWDCQEKWPHTAQKHTINPKTSWNTITKRQLRQITTTKQATNTVTFKGSFINLHNNSYTSTVQVALKQQQTSLWLVNFFKFWKNFPTI